MMHNTIKGILVMIAAMILLTLPRNSFSETTLSPSVEAENFSYDSHGKRDPFWKLIGHRGTIVSYDNDIQATDMVLEGVMVEPSGDSIAIINGNIVKVSDKVGLYVVKRIQTNEVVLEKGQEIFTLKLKKEE